MTRGMKASEPVRLQPKPGGQRRSFVAQYAGGCASCGVGILPGDQIFYAPGNEAASGLECCGDKDDADLVVVQRRDTEDEPNMTVDPASVMPRGRTARDVHRACGQIPASNGTCGCDY